MIYVAMNASLTRIHNRLMTRGSHADTVRRVRLCVISVHEIELCAGAIQL